ncbi:protein FAM118B [Platysternon megacephalum]|uniref:Protein FAM118B n=1 Tax=Platysternon megacephalum TaxID=55544 RepID=A0A4D9EJE4_9SAUR|nr:protein FAM118B [Platysternon megacephalum]
MTFFFAYKMSNINTGPSGLWPPFTVTKRRKREIEENTINTGIKIKIIIIKGERNKQGRKIPCHPMVLHKENTKLSQILTLDLFFLMHQPIKNDTEVIFSIHS